VTLDGNPLGTGPESTRGLSQSVVFDQSTATYHMWYKSGGTQIDSGTQASDLYDGDLPTFRHATSTDGLSFTSTSNLSYTAPPTWLSTPTGSPPASTPMPGGYTPPFVFPRVTNVDGTLKLQVWSYNHNGSSAHNYNVTVFDLSNDVNGDPTQATHIGPAAYPGINGGHTMGFVEYGGETKLVAHADTASPNLDSVRVWDYNEPVDANGYVPITIDGTGVLPRAVQVARAIGTEDSVIRVFFGQGTWRLKYDSANFGPGHFDIGYMESTDGGLTWSLSSDIFGGNGSSLVVNDGEANEFTVHADSIFNAPEVTLLDPDSFRLYMNVTDAQGNEIVVSGLGEVQLIPEPASLGLLAAGGLMLLRRKRA
jgi:hypothetical protein